MNDLINLKHGCKRFQRIKKSPYCACEIAQIFFSFFVFHQSQDCTYENFSNICFPFLFSHKSQDCTQQPAPFLSNQSQHGGYYVINLNGFTSYGTQTYIVCLKYASFSLPFLRASIHWSVKQAGMGGGGFKRPAHCLLLIFDSHD